MSKYRPEILTGYDQSDVDEPIEPLDELSECQIEVWERTKRNYEAGIINVDSRCYCGAVATHDGCDGVEASDDEPYVTLWDPNDPRCDDHACGECRPRLKDNKGSK